MVKNHPNISYLLGLLAKIKCSICSYQLNLWYVDNCRLWVLSVFFKQSTDTKCDVVLGLKTCTFSLDLCKLTLFNITCNKYSYIMLLKYHRRRASNVILDNANFRDCEFWFHKENYPKGKFLKNLHWYSPSTGLHVSWNPYFVTN